MDSQHFICQLEGTVRAAVELSQDETQQWQLLIRLFHDNVPVGTTHFTLHGYSEAEAQTVARNIRTSPFIMREIDETLWGEMD